MIDFNNIFDVTHNQSQSTEGVFDIFSNKYLYTSGDYNNEMKSLDTVRCHKDLKTAVTRAVSNLGENAYNSFGKIIGVEIRGKNINKLNDNLTIYKIESEKTVKHMKQRSGHGDENNLQKPFKEIEKETKTYNEWIKKFGIKVIVKGVSTPGTNRKTEANNVKSILIPYAKTILEKGFEISVDADEMNEFVNDDNDSFTIIFYDAWKFTDGKARNDDEYEKFDKALVDLLNKLNEFVKSKPDKFHGKISTDGDWDDGYIEYTLDKNRD